MDPRSKNLVFWTSDSNSPCKTVYIPSWKGLEAKNLVPKCQKFKNYDLTLGGYMFGRWIVQCSKNSLEMFKEFPRNFPEMSQKIPGKLPRGPLPWGQLETSLL